jgi:hypothetical protein
MAKILEKEEAIRLRKLGKSYKEIRSILPVSKGSLSLWLRGYPLSPEQLRELRDWNAERIEHYRETRARQREAKLAIIYESQKEEILPLSQRELFIAGLFLYWGEGGKSDLFDQVTFSNTDPSMINFFLKWIEGSFGFPREKIKIRMHFYKDMDIEKETEYWADILKISKSQFYKPYIKEGNLASLSYKRGFGHGTCNVIVGNAMLGKKIMMSLKVVSNFSMGQ